MCNRVLLRLVVTLVIALPLCFTQARSEDAPRLRKLSLEVEELVAEGKYSEAVPLAKEAVTLEEEAHSGNDHASIANRLDVLAGLYRSLGHHAEAEPLYRRALAIREKVLGSDHPDVVDSLDSLAQLYASQRQYVEAEPFYKRALAIREKVRGPTHPDTADSLDSLSRLYEAQGRYPDAEPLLKRALAIREKALGPGDAVTANNLDRLALVYEFQGRYAEAEPLYKRALAFDEKYLGPEVPLTARSLGKLADLYRLQGRYAEAGSLYQRVVSIYEKNLGPDHSETAASINNLGLLYQIQGRYAEAEPLLNRALSIREKTLGPQHVDTAASLNDLALLHDLEGRYAEAELLHKRALAIREETLGPTHHDTSTSLNNLALLYDSQGRYAEAEPLYKRALAIEETVLGPQHPNTATSLNNLAALYQSQGRYEEAEPLLKRARAICEKALGPDHRLTAVTLNNLALLYQSQGRYAAAEPLYKRAITIREEALGPEHPDTARSLNTLADLYRLQGGYDEAEPLYERALAIREKTLGPEHPDTARSLNALADLYRVQGRYNEAETLYERALTIRESALGPEHPEKLTNLENLADLHRNLGRWSLAVDGLRAACSIGIRRAPDSARCYATLLDSYWRWSTSPWDDDWEHTLSTRRNEAVAVAQRVGADTVGVAFGRGAAHLIAKRSGTEGVAVRWEETRAQMAALDAAFSAAAGSGGPDLARVLVDLNSERDRLSAELTQTEEELKAKAPDFFDLIKPEPVSVEDLQATSGEKAKILRPDEALIILVPGNESEDKAYDRESLILVVSKTKVGWAAVPRTIDILGQPQPLARVISSVQGSARSGQRMKKSESNLIPFDLDIAHGLYKALFASSDEIKTVLEDPAIKTWVLAPQGMFISLPYSTLVMGQPSGDSRNPDTLRKTKWLGIERTLTIVPSVSSLAIERLKLTPEKQSVFAPEVMMGLGALAALALLVFLWRRSRSESFRNALKLPIAGGIVALVYCISGISDRSPEFLGFGDPDFARSNDSRSDCPHIVGDARADTPALDTLFQGINTNPKSVRELKRLPGTCREVKSMAEAFKAPRSNVVLGMAASEAGVRSHPRISKARIIAFATHGLITGSLNNTLAQPALAFTPPAEVKDQLPPIEDDGLLTTTDAATLDLEADWVLLSACDTAAKEGTDPDGLSGLARAFFYAGARSLLVSHWKVDDEAGMRLTTKAVELMAEDPSLTRPQAFRLSMKALLDDTSDNRFAHPAFWAPFFIVSPE